MKDEKPGWQYKPEDDGQDPAAPNLAQAVDNELQKPTRGAKSKGLSWTASEYIDHKQGPMWFVALAVGTIGLAAIIYLLTHDYFAVGITATLGIVVGVFAKRTPRELTYELSEDGLAIGQKTYPYRIFKSFSLIQDGALLSLDLMPIKRFMPPVSVYFSAADQEKIVTILEDHLPYEERQLEAVERLTRRLRF